jgi:predicted small metal-binding protein
MDLKCDDVVAGLGCDFVATGASGDEVHAAMMAHGGAAHASLMEGKTPAEMEHARVEMDAHIRQLISAGG